MVKDFISLGNELKPEPRCAPCELFPNFISLGNELKPELTEFHSRLLNDFISLGNELKPELIIESTHCRVKFYIVRKRA